MEVGKPLKTLTICHLALSTLPVWGQRENTDHFFSREREVRKGRIYAYVKTHRTISQKKKKIKRKMRRRKREKRKRRRNILLYIKFK